jgi:hypothetical protein
VDADPHERGGPGAARALNLRHCEKRSDEAIQEPRVKELDCSAEPVLGPTNGRTRGLATTLRVLALRHSFTAPVIAET